VLASILALLSLSAFVPLGLVAARKVSQVGRADILVSHTPGGLLVRAAGRSAGPAGLREGDLILDVDGRDAATAGDPASWLARGPADVTLLRHGELRTIRTQPVPAPWDVRYFFLFLTGLAFLVAGLAALATAGKSPSAGASRLFSAFSLCVALVLGLTPVPPVDAFFRLSVLLEDVARASFPALLILLVFVFPRRSSRVLRAAAFLPSAALLAATWSVYFGGEPDRDAKAAVATLDRLQVVWIAAGVAIALVRLLVLWRRPGDLLVEKQVRYLLLGTGIGLLPVVALNLVPGLFGLSIPVLSALSVVPLALVPFAFLAALTRFRLWDAEVFGRESAALVGAGLAGAALFAAAQLLVSRASLPHLPYARTALEVAAGLVLALSFVPARRGLSAALARLQYGEAWSAREELLSLVRDLAAPRSAAEIEHLLVSRTTRALGAAPAALLPVLADGQLPAEDVDGGMPLSLAELPPEAARRTVRLSRRTRDEMPTSAIQRLRAAGFRTLSPLSASGRLLAVFSLGDRLGRVPLSHEDIELLETVLAPAALALDHARLYDEVRAQAESYRLLKEFHEDVVAGSAAAIASTDAEGRFASVNPAFAELAGRTAAELVGRAAGELLPAALLGDETPRRIEADLGGGLRVLDVAVSLFPGAPRGSKARVYVLHDATETARLERVLAERERLAALGSLSAGVAHEVNTPLTGVAGFARVLLDETPEGDPRRPVLEKIERQAFRASRLVGSLLDLARGAPRERAPVDACALAREAMRVFEEEVGARGVELTVDLPPEAPRVFGHADALLQVVVNLLKNGAEAALSRGGRMPPAAPPAVRLSVQAGDGKVLLVVEDNGPGLPPLAPDRVFEPFFSTKTSHGGTGLGLTIARDIIRGHGGALDVAPRPDGGARFTVTLPPAP
jgi:two-component system NtrC family sensor kinase